MKVARFSRRPGHLVLTLAACCAAAAGLFAAGLSAARRPASAAPTAAEVEAALFRAGVTPAALAAAGVGANAVAGVVSEAREHLETNFEGLRSADAAVAEKRAEADRLEALIRAGKGGPQDPAALAAARTQLGGAEADRNGRLRDLYDAALAGVAQVRRESVNTIKAQSAWDLPTQYLAAARSEADWVALRDALANQRFATSRGEEIDPGSAALLAERNAEAPVAAAKANLDANLAGVEAAWRTALDW